MPTIPSYDQPQVQSRALGAPQISTAPSTADNSGLVSGLGRLSSAVTQEVAKAREDADTAALMEADSALQQAKLNLLFDPEKGAYARKGKNALNVTNETLPQFDASVEQIGRGLTSKAQRARFAQIVNSQRNGLNGELNRYEHGERQVYQDAADRANMDQSVQGALQYADNPDMVAYYRNKGAAVLGNTARRKGLPPEQLDQALTEFNSQVATGVITRMAGKDPFKAQQYFAREASGMTPSDQEKVGSMLGIAVRKQAAVGIADNLWLNGDVGNEGLVALVIKNESGGQIDAVSPKGALGVMQLMPETAKETAGELGVPYDEQRLTIDPQYNMALGTAYLNKMLGRYGGDQTLAVAAYNAGPGSVDAWLKENGDPRTGEISPADWVAKIPYKETREYTSKIMTDATPTAPGHQSYADALKGAERLADPELKKDVIAHLEQKKKAAKAETDALYEDAAEYVESSSYGYSAIPAAILSQLPTDDRIKLRALSDKMARGTAIATDYEKFEGFLAMPTEQLGELSLARDIRPYLSDSDFNTARAAWTAARKGDATPQGAAKAELDIVNRGMAMSGITVGTSKDAMKPANLKRQDQFRAALETRKSAFRLEHGVEPGAKDLQELVDQMTLGVRLTGGGTIFGDSSAQPLWKAQPEALAKAYVDKGDITIDDVPANKRRQIVESLRATGRPASEANIIADYLNRINNLGIGVK